MWKIFNYSTLTHFARQENVRHLLHTTEKLVFSTRARKNGKHTPYVSLCWSDVCFPHTKRQWRGGCDIQRQRRIVGYHIFISHGTQVHRINRFFFLLFGCTQLRQTSACRQQPPVTVIIRPTVVSKRHSLIFKNKIRLFYTFNIDKS